MLLLVGPNRNEVSLIEQDVRHHQHWIGEQSGIHILGMAGALVFELGHPAQLSKLGVAGQDPVQFSVGFDMALDKCDRLFRVNPAGEQQRIGREGIFPQGFGILPDGDRVLVNDRIAAVVFFLHQLPVANRAQVVAQSEGSGRLDAGKGDFFVIVLFHGNLSFQIRIGQAGYHSRVSCPRISIPLTIA